MAFGTQKPDAYCKLWWYEMKQILLRFIVHTATDHHVGIDKKIPIHI